MSPILPQSFGEEVVIGRDEYGVPQVFAETNKGLFTGYGYAVAQDRLWQLELFRHAAQGATCLPARGAPRAEAPDAIRGRISNSPSWARTL